MFHSILNHTVNVRCLWYSHEALSEVGGALGVVLLLGVRQLDRHHQAHVIGLFDERRHYSLFTNNKESETTWALQSFN